MTRDFPRHTANFSPEIEARPSLPRRRKAAVEGLVSAGEAAHKAALTKNLDEMLAVSETVVNSCSACHDTYRDVDLEGGTRCQVQAKKK